MATTGKNEKLIELAGEVAAALNDYDGDPTIQRQLLQQVDNMRRMLEVPMDPIFKQWEMVSIYHDLQIPTIQFSNTSQMVVSSAMNLLVETGALDKMPLEGSISSKDLAELVHVEESAISEIPISPVRQSMVLIKIVCR